MSEIRIVYLPQHQRQIFLLTRKLKKKKEKDNLKIFNSNNRDKMSNSINLATLKSDISDIDTNISDQITEIENNISEKLESGQVIGKVSIKDDETATTYHFKMHQTYDIDGPNIYLTNKKNVICGRGSDWYDENNEVPDEFKSDGVVCRPPDYYEPIISFSIKGHTPLENKIYREFRYLTDRSNDQYQLN